MFTYVNHVGGQPLCSFVQSAMKAPIQGCATRDSKTGDIFLKLVNPQVKTEPLKIEINGVASIASKAAAIVLAGKLEDSNSITQPRAVISVTETVRHLKPDITYAMPPHSIVVLKLLAL